jgi:hypothetical protein
MKTGLALLVAAGLVGCSESAGPQPEPAEPVDVGKMRVEISGAVQLAGEWEAFGQFRDVLASDGSDFSRMRGGNPQPATGDSNFTVLFPGRLDVGEFAIGRYVPGGVLTGPVAAVEFDSTFYASLPGGTLTVDSANYPPRPGLEFGVLRGTLMFKAVRLVAGPGGLPVETTDTITVRATFADRWYHYIFPNVSVTLSGGGPLVGTSTFTTALSSPDDHGGRYVSWQSDFGPGHTFPHDISQELRVASPGVGTFTLPPITPTQWADPNQWPAVYIALFYRDDPRLGLSTGGTLTVTNFLAPTDEYYGEIRGTLSSRLALWTDNTTLSGDSTTVAVVFAVQLWPLGGIPTSR